ncbi:39kDa subunit of ndufa9, NADH:ubiquinone oxidoreductase [Cichlidogyrus casuarinus]|uniref:NADH dehydrogenase [ubiquinone] 1 alpha subcomplex subunit 9, mitochondrial n=1 Tax=Cichlidogyrus casuarinus TaxID=1844966 RepID=A0ABD2QC35_9PLAT
MSILLKHFFARYTPKTTSVGVCAVNAGQQRNYSVDPTLLASLKRGTGGRSSFNGMVVTVFGAHSYLGRHVVSILGRTGTQIILPYRGDPYFMRDFKVLGDLGQVLFLPFHLCDEETIRRAMQHSHAVINLIGKETNTRNFSLHDVHVDGAARLARISKELEVDHFIHISAMVQNLKPPRFVLAPSEFARTKALGEIEVLKERPDATIIRPAEIWGPQDNYLFYYASPPRKVSPMRVTTIPLWAYGKKTIKQPVFASDLAQGIVNALTIPQSKGQIYEAVGPHRYRLDDLIKWIYMQTRHLPQEINISDIWHPYFLARVRLNEYMAHVSPLLNFEKLEREFTTDTLSDKPTLNDLGVDKLTKIEDRIHHILYVFRREKYYTDALGEFPEPPNPPLSPI